MTTKRNVVRQMTSYFGIGVTCAALYLVLAMALKLHGFEAWTASVGAYLILIPVNYFAQRHITFQSDVPHLSSFLKFVVTHLLGLSLAGLLPYLLVTNGPLSPAAGFAIVTLVVSCLSFGLLKFWTFAEHA